MNPRSLWTLPLWGRGSFVSCTVCTFTLNLQWRQPHRQPGGWEWGSTIHGNMFYRASWEEERPTEKRLQLELQLWRSVSNFDTDTDTDTYSTTRASATVQQLMSTSFQKEMTITTSTSFVEWKLTSPRRSVSNFDAPLSSRLCQFPHDTDRDTPSHKYVHIRHRTSGCEHVCLTGKRRYSASFVERKYTSPRRCAYNFDTNSTTHDWDREAAYGKQRRSSWDRDTTGLCVTFGGAVDWKSRHWKPTAQSTTELRTRHRVDAFNGMGGRMAVWEELRPWHGLASVFWLLSSVWFQSVFQWLSVWRTW